MTDFGTLKLVANRLQPADENGNHFAFVLDPEYLSISYLEGTALTLWLRPACQRSGKFQSTSACDVTLRSLRL